MMHEKKLSQVGRAIKLKHATVIVGRTPRFLVAGSETLQALEAECWRNMDKDCFPLSGVKRLLGLEVVRVHRDCMEIGWSAETEELCDIPPPGLPGSPDKI